MRYTSLVLYVYSTQSVEWTSQQKYILTHHLLTLPLSISTFAFPSLQVSSEYLTSLYANNLTRSIDQ